VDDLLGGFPKQLGGVVEHARGKLLAAAGVHEEVNWQGVWKWTLLYRLPEHGDGRAWVYVVPDPVRPRMAVPVAEGTIAELPLKKMSKYIRDGLAHAATVDGVRWPQWDVQTKAQVDDVMSLAQFRAGARPGR